MIMIKLIKKQASTWFRLLFVFLGFGGATLTYANPDDALDQLLRQRQQFQQRDSDGLENLILMQSTETNTNTSFPQLTERSLRLSKTMKRRAERRAAHQEQEKQKHEESKVEAKHAVATSSQSRSDADALLSNAMGLLGVAYRFGGTSPTTGFDCSGFMQHVFRKAFAVNLPRTSAQQARVGTYVSRSNLQPGDMVFFRTSGRRISHVGMYVGNNRFIHAPRTGKSIEITNLGNRYWNARYATARRVTH